MNKQAATIIALLLLAVACGLAYWGYDTANQPGFELIKRIDESRRNEVIGAYTGAGACVLVSLYLLLFYKK